MSFPNIPNVTPTISVSRTQVQNLLLASIAFEELGLAHIINAEGEKIQFALALLAGGGFPPGTHPFDALISIDRSVETMLRTVIKNQMLLQFKLEDVLNITCPTVTC